MFQIRIHWKSLCCCVLFSFNVTSDGKFISTTHIQKLNTLSSFTFSLLPISKFIPKYTKWYYNHTSIRVSCIQQFSYISMLFFFLFSFYTKYFVIPFTMWIQWIFKCCQCYSIVRWYILYYFLFFTDSWLLFYFSVILPLFNIAKYVIMFSNTNKMFMVDAQRSITLNLPLYQIYYVERG